ncbi:hypothetical protein SK355_13635 [Candidatus Fukatsuia symbiotica]|uniref:hypothetical protein n=1 Tax=Candidatus Fukatsuia symbiotica TaxID=1878942 RepID=UPI0019672303|nr:hypothetical protein [Candidatus Fukatsuia symbiotica]MEA9446188.1 hypothetical protein [Candidatus Fukatsuia symbiotica]
MRVPPLYPNKLIACFAKKTQSCAHLRGRRVNSLLLLGLLIPEFEPVALFVEKHPVLAPSPAFVYRPPSGYPICADSFCPLYPLLEKGFFSKCRQYKALR